MHLALVLAALTLNIHQPNMPLPAVTPPTAAASTVLGYHIDAGPFDVSTTESFTLTDADRDKKLHFKVRVPVPRPGATPDERPFPLLVFSHGLGGSKDAFGDLARHLASHGYVVINPTHADSIQARVAAGERVTRDNAFDIRRMTPEARWGRVADLTLILDSLDIIEKAIPALRAADGSGRIDRARIAVAGHSAGAHTTQLIAGMKSRDAENPEGDARGDPRIRAAVVISGQGVNGRGIREDAWSEVKIPWLVMTGSLDTASVSRETPASRRHPFEKARGLALGGPPAYLLWIDGATHSSFGGKAVVRTLREAPTTDVETIERCVRSMTLAFLDAHVRGNEEAKAYLTKPDIETLSDAAATFTSK